MITGLFFLVNINDCYDLLKAQSNGLITPEEYKELKEHSLNYINHKYFIWTHKKNKFRNTKMWNKFYHLYSDVLERMNKIESEWDNGN